MSTDPVTVSDVGEFGLIARIREGLTMTGDVIVGPGDDAAEVSTGESVLISVDILVEGRHFRRDWCSAVDVGRRAAAASLADIAAMGGTSTAVVVGFGAPPDLPAAWAQQCAAGVAEQVRLSSVVTSPRQIRSSCRSPPSVTRPSQVLCFGRVRNPVTCSRSMDASDGLLRAWPCSVVDSARPRSSSTLTAFLRLSTGRGRKPRLAAHTR
jgi:hypothetical protein